MTRPLHNHIHPVWVEADDVGVCRQLVYRMTIKGGRRIWFCIAYQIRDQSSGRLKDIVRYDNYGGFFHRHNAGFPPGKQHISINLEPGMTELEYVERDLEQHADEYEVEALKLGYDCEQHDDEEHGDVTYG